MIVNHNDEKETLFFVGAVIGARHEGRYCTSQSFRYKYLVLLDTCEKHDAATGWCGEANLLFKKGVTKFLIKNIE
jgi:hypothetical protein